jgi:voltage-gated potassium channel
VTSPAASDARLRTWQRRTEWPLTAIALLFFVAYAWPILAPDLPEGLRAAAEVVAWTAWAAFALDYAVGLCLAPARREYIRRHWLDLIVVALPLLRPLRLLRLLTLLGALHAKAGSRLRGQVAVYAAGGTALMSVLAALAVLDAERRAPEGTANITGFGDALWWAITTMTTVGYGDRFPVTAAGRAVAVALMVCGIALLGVVTAMLASWLVQRVSEAEEDSQAATRRQVAELTAEVRALREHLIANDDPSQAIGAPASQRAPALGSPA